MAKQDKQFEGVEVEIFGHSYRIGGEPEKIQPAAEYVDRKMQEIAENHDARLPALQVAILAAMEVAAEFLSLDKERQEFADKANESISRLTQKVEERVDLPAGGGSDEEELPVERRLRGTIEVEDSSSS